MKAILTSFLFATLLLTGCVKTVSRQELDAAIHSRDHETVSWVRYAGSKDGYHYIFHGRTIGSDMYRIAESGLKIDAPFPLTKDQGKWRTLKQNGEIWGRAKMVLADDFCPVCREIAAERIRVDAGLIMTNYDGSSSLVSALRLNRDPPLVKSAQDMIASYEQIGKTSLVAVCVYAPHQYVQFARDAFTLSSDPDRCGTALLSAMFVGNGQDMPHGLYDAATDQVVVVGSKYQVNNMVMIYTNALPRWFHDLQCRKHPMLSDHLKLHHDRLDRLGAEDVPDPVVIPYAIEEERNVYLDQYRNGYRSGQTGISICPLVDAGSPHKEAYVRGWYDGQGVGMAKSPWTHETPTGIRVDGERKPKP